MFFAELLGAYKGKIERERTPLGDKGRCIAFSLYNQEETKEIKERERTKEKGRTFYIDLNLL